MFIKNYIIAFVVFFAVDMVWLGLVARNFYAKQIGFLMKTDINWISAIIFYALFVAGIVFFVVSPAIEKQSLMYALLAGAFFGLITYATYDLTNLATLKNWPVLLTVVDLLWGTFLSATVSTITYLIVTKFI